MEAPMNLGAAEYPVSRELPPLILHPFNERATPSDLLENSKAALILSGLMPHDGVEPDELRRRLLAGRYSEIRMLFFLGRDVFRWSGAQDPRGLTTRRSRRKASSSC
jgi:hypothetical protein